VTRKQSIARLLEGLEDSETRRENAKREAATLRKRVRELEHELSRVKARVKETPSAARALHSQYLSAATAEGQQTLERSLANLPS